MDIPPEAVAALSEHPNIIAIKESSGNLEKVMQMIREVRPGFQVLVGSAPTLWPSLLMGACGAILAYRQCGAVLDDRDLGGVPRARGSGGARLAEPHRAAAVLVTTKYGIPGLEVRHGSERLLRRAAAAAVERAGAGGEGGDRGGVPGFEGVLSNQWRQFR